MRFYIVAVTALLSAVSVVSPAAAERIDILSSRPPQSPEAAMLGSLTVERFEGEDGTRLAFRLEEMLRSYQVAGEPFFVVTTAGAEGLFQGVASASVETRRVPEQRRECAEYDPDDEDQCLAYENVRIICRARIVSFSPAVRLVRTADGAVLANYDRQQRAEQSWCPTENEQPDRTIEDIVQSMIDTAAREIRDGIVPVTRRNRIRVRESRSGLAREWRDSFRQAVLTVETDVQAACNSWAEIDEAAPDHPSVVYNLALCSEHFNLYDRAETYWRRTRQLLPDDDEPGRGLGRISAERAYNRFMDTRREELADRGY